MFDDIFLFLELAEYKSFKVVSNLKNTYPSTISRRIQSLEQKINCKLYFINHNNQLEITEDGLRLYEIFVPIKTIASEGRGKFISSYELSGELTLVIQPFLYNLLFVEDFFETIKAYPKLKINFKHSFYSELGHLVPFDIALSAEVPNIPSFIQQSMLKIKLGFYASKNYIKNHSELMTIEKFSFNEFIVYDFLNHGLIKTTKLTDNSGDFFDLKIENYTFTCTSMRAAKILAEKDLGIAALPVGYQAANLDRVFSTHVIEHNLPVYLIQSSQVQNTKKSILINLIKSALRENFISF